MPFGDGTGPAGMGPMTGREAGYCAGYSVPGYMNPYRGRLGVGVWNPYVRVGFPIYYRTWRYPVPLWGGWRFFGFGRGYGWGRWWW